MNQIENETQDLEDRGGQYNEYIIILSFIDKNAYSRLTTPNGDITQIYKVLNKKQNKYSQYIVNLRVLIIGNEHLILCCKSKSQSVRTIAEVMDEVKSDLSCLSLGRLFKKQYSIEYSQLITLEPIYEEEDECDAFNECGELEL